jgi:hypothetical protein
MNRLNLQAVLDESVILLTKIFFRMREVNIEIMRVSEVATVLLEMGLKKDGDIIHLFNEIIKLKNNAPNISEKICCLEFLSYFPEAKKIVTKNINFLFRHINKDGGLGRFVGDRSRIPVSWKALESFYLNNHPYDKNIKKIVDWMQKEWKKDMKRGGLSYKCAGVLLANSYYPYFNKRFISKSIMWLLDDQNRDGGWGPRKDSPVGSVPSYTALALRALTNYKSEEIRKSIRKGVKWLIKNRLKNRFWKEHPAEVPLIHICLFLNKYLNLKNGTKFH